MAVKYRGLPREYANVYNGWVLEDIQEASRGFYPQSVYEEWESTKSYVDSGEQLPFVSAPQAEQPPSEEKSDDEEEAGDSDVEEVDALFRGGNMSPSAMVLAQMQGAKKGQRPVTAVLTEAEKLKFDRSVLGFLTTSPASGNRNQHQFIDYDAMAESWNDDVALEEEQVRKGLVVECGHNIVNRKTPSGLKFHMNELKRALNAKRTLAPHKEQLQALNKSQRVSLMPFKSAAGASVPNLPKMRPPLHHGRLRRQCLPHSVGREIPVSGERRRLGR